MSGSSGMRADELLVSSTDRMLAEQSAATVRRRAERDGWAGDLWRTLVETGLPYIGVPLEREGAGGSLADAAAVLRLAGRYATPVPLAENGFLGGWLLAEAGLNCPVGILTVPVALDVDLQVRAAGERWIVDGILDRVPWGRDAQWVVALARAEDGLRVVCIPLDRASVERHRSLAGEPRDTVTMVGVELHADRVGPATDAYLLERVIQRGALARSLQMAGAMERIAEMTVGYVWERKQFGRPIGSFQAVQQHLVLLNSEAAAASMAVAVVVATGETAKRRAEVGLAKEIANSAATIVARLAHQAHGAIGMTEEYELQQYTRRLWVWRQEFGSSTYWRARIGTEVVAAGADRLWDRLTGVGSRRSLA